MVDLNPFAPPTDLGNGFPQGAESAGREYFRQGDCLVVSRLAEVSLPNRCVICNRGIDGAKRRRKIYWHHPLLYLLILSPVIYAIVALITRKSVVLQVGLCASHKRRRLLGGVLIVLSFLSLFALPAAMDISSPDNLATVLLCTVLVMLGCLIAGVILLRWVKVTRMTDTEAWLRIGKPFLESIPERRF